MVRPEMSATTYASATCISLRCPAWSRWQFSTPMQTSATTTGKPNAARTPTASAASRNAPHVTGRVVGEVLVEARVLGVEGVDARSLADHELERLDVAGHVSDAATQSRRVPERSMIPDPREPEHFDARAAQ